MTPVKICGITRFEDAMLAARLGAACVGFVFWPQSPRFVEPAVAAHILAALPPHVAGVGVFVNQPIEEVNAIADRVGLGAVQLHGDEPAAACARCTRRVIKAVRLSTGSTPDVVDAVWSGATVLLDALDPVRMGGTGRHVDWTLAARIARRRRTILSGGLRTSADLVDLGAAGYHAFLIGEALITTPEPGETLGRLIDGAQPSATSVGTSVRDVAAGGA